MTRTHQSLAEVVERFAQSQRNKSTRRAYRADVMQFLSSLELSAGNLSELQRITYPDLKDMVRRFLDGAQKTDPHTGIVLNPNTINRKRYALSAFFRFLMDDYDYQRNPAAGMKRLRTSDISTTPAMSEEEIRSVMSYLRDHHDHNEGAFRNYLIVLGLFHFALRRRELVNLRWDHICEHPLYLKVIQKRNKVKILPIPEQYMALLTRFAGEYGKPSDYIFHPIQNNRTRELNKPLSTNYILKLVKRIGQEVLGRNITPHSFRGSFVTLSRMYGLDDKEIMHATGHSSSVMINYYDVREQLETNAVNFFGSWIDV